MEHSFFKELIHYNKPKESPLRLIGAGLCMISILFTGYLLHQLTISSFGSLGIFTFLYYQRLPLKQLMIRLADRKSTRLNSSHSRASRMPSSA